MMQEDQKGCKKNKMRAKEEQIAAARAKQYKDEEQHTDMRPAGRVSNKIKKCVCRCLFYYKTSVANKNKFVPKNTTDQPSLDERAEQ